MPDQANHAIRDGDLPIVYISGNKGLYKFFPDSGEIALMKAVAGDEVAYMTAYGSLTRRTLPVPIAIELVFVPGRPTGYSITDPRYKFKHYKPDGTVTLRDPPLVGVEWGGIEISPFNPDKWLTWTPGNVVGSYAAFFSNDAGATWTAIASPPGGSNTRINISHAFWSRLTEDVVWLAGSSSSNAVNQRVHIYHGGVSTTLDRFDLTTNARNAQWIYAGTTDDGGFVGRMKYGGGTALYKHYVVSSTGSTSTEQVIPINELTAGARTVQVPGTSVVFVATNSPFPDGNKNLFRTTNYMVSEVSDTGVVANTVQIVATADAHVYLGGSASNGVREVLTPLATPTIASAPVIGPGLSTQAITVDPSTRSVVAALSIRVPSELYLFVLSGGVWQELALTEVIDPNWILDTDFAVIVRS